MAMRMRLLLFSAALAACTGTGQPRDPGMAVLPSIADACTDGADTGRDRRRTADLPASGGDTVFLYSLGKRPTIAPSAAEDELGAMKRWYVEDRVICFGGDRYAKFGWALGTRPREPGQSADTAVFAGTYDGVPVYAGRVPGLSKRILYVKLNDAGQYQPYAEVAALRATG